MFTPPLAELGYAALYLVFGSGLLAAVVIVIVAKLKRK